MTRSAALYGFFNSFGIPAYVSTSVPDEVKMPYITYTYGTAGFNTGSYSSTVNIWYRTSSEEEPNAKAEQLFETITEGGAVIPYDGGMIWVKPGSPWCQSVADPDQTIKRRYINVEIEYL